MLNLILLIESNFLGLTFFSYKNTAWTRKSVKNVEADENGGMTKMDKSHSKEQYTR